MMSHSDVEAHVHDRIAAARSSSGMTGGRLYDATVSSPQMPTTTYRSQKCGQIGSAHLNQSLVGHE